MQPTHRALVPVFFLATLAALPAAAQDDYGLAYRDRPSCSEGVAVDDATREANLAVVRAFVTEGLAMGDAGAFDRYIAEDVWVVTGLKPDGPIESRDEYRNTVFATLGKALEPTTAALDIREALVTTDGRVLIRFIADADHVGEVDGVPGAGRRITMAEMHLFCVRDGMIVENYVGGMNPLMWQMIYRDNIAAAVLPPVVE